MYEKKTKEQRKKELEKEGIEWPLCFCHNYPKHWKPSSKYQAGGTWACRVKFLIRNRENPKRYRAEGKA